ncbi:hypothetical protein ANN_23166 [Periplaneta americana]|uniref:Uncharacterized protein n=1 Tax=Periplaneta americana TaxID=6978 RepID=A0ABQ8SKC6_PERAM|nr:hypothetical protein ANN_23166 [Periplaneta americana]
MNERGQTAKSTCAKDFVFGRYSGQHVVFKQNTDIEIKRRITSVWKAFWSLKFILLGKAISRKLRFETLETCIQPVILYGCQTWALSTKQYAAIQTYQRKMQRKILGVTLKDKFPNDSLQKLAKTSDAAEYAMMTKWKWGTLDENGALKIHARDHHVGPIHRKKEPGKTTTQMGGYVCEDDGQTEVRKSKGQISVERTRTNTN